MTKVSARDGALIVDIDVDVHVVPYDLGAEAVKDWTSDDLISLLAGMADEFTALGKRDLEFYERDFEALGPVWKRDIRYMLEIILESL